MAVERKLMTADELFRMPDDGMRHELVKGELLTMSPLGAEHGWITGKIHASLWNFVEAHGLGEVLTGEPGFVLTTDPDTVRAPDVAFLRSDRLPQGALPRTYWLGAPDLAVEVISPNDRLTEVRQKVAEWLEHGTRVVLVVNPRRRTVKVCRPGQPEHTLTEDDTLSAEDVVPGWSIPVRTLFR